jgi:exodeoxyribonuclease VII large subunit
LSVTATFTVSQITRLIKEALEITFPTLWVEGEISGFRPSASGHCYFTLKDSSAQLPVVMFRRETSQLPFVPEDGMHVLVRGRLSVYEVRGAYQLIAEEMEPRGRGAIREALERLRQTLDAEGLFAQERKRSLPRYPAVIGVVTSATGAAIRDILEIFREKEAHVNVVLAPAIVQGAEAPESIIAALVLLSSNTEVDLIILGRGGGSFEDLVCFSDERVVRAVARSPVPIVSAVGHEIDMSLSDLAADARAPTPSAAAEMVIRSLVEAENTLDYFRDKLAKTVRGVMDNGRNRLSAAESRLVHPRHLLDQGKMRTDDLSFRLSSLISSGLERRHADLERLAGMLMTLGPPSVLRRGYAVVSKEDGAVVRSPVDVSINEKLGVRVAEGEFGVRVLERERKN